MDDSPTYQCVVCQSTCLTPNELHRHQSYSHTSEELSLSIIGIHNAAIRTFDLPSGIVYDNSWLYDPNRHAEFYTYSANMLCDDNNNDGVIDYAFKTFNDNVAKQSTDDADRCIDEKYQHDNFVEAQNFEKLSWVGESKILDLGRKIDLEVEAETRMDTASDNFWGCGEGLGGEAENLGIDTKKPASFDCCAVKTSIGSVIFEKVQTDVGPKVFLKLWPETRTDRAADNFEDCQKRFHGDSENLEQDVHEKSEDRKIKTRVKVQNFDEPQCRIYESPILDLSQKICPGVQPEARMDTAADHFGKCDESLRNDVGNLGGEAAKRRLSLSECPAKSKARKLTMPRDKLDGPKRILDKSENTKNRSNSETSKVTRFKDKVKRIRTSQKGALDLTKEASKHVEGDISGKAETHTMQGCGRDDAIRPSANFHFEDLSGFDEKEATIDAACSRNAKSTRVSRKKGKVCETGPYKSAKETAQGSKKSFDEETEIIRISADQSSFNLKSKKSKIQTPTAENAKKRRVFWKKGNDSKTGVHNFARLPKRSLKKETGSVESVICFDVPSSLRFSSANTKKPIASKNIKARNCKTVADKPTKRETTKSPNEKYPKEVGPRPNWDYESADFLVSSKGDGQNITATCEEKAEARAEKTAVDVTDAPTEPSEKEIQRTSDKSKNEDYGNDYYYYFPNEEAKVAAMSSSSGSVKKPSASGNKSNNLKTITVWPAKQKISRKIVSDGNGNLSKQNSVSSRDVFSYTGSESEESTITPLSKFRAERSSPFGKKPTKINAGVENSPEHNSNFVPNIYTCTDSASKQIEIQVPSTGEPEKRQVTSKKSKNSETFFDKPVVDETTETARGITKLFYQNFASEMFASQNSPPIIDVSSSTERRSDEEIFTKATGNEQALRGIARKAKNSQSREHDNVISIYKDSSFTPGDSSACDNELPPVTFVAYPPYANENSIIVLNPESRQLVWGLITRYESAMIR